MDNNTVNICKQTSVNKCKQRLEIDITDLDSITSPLSIRIPASYKAVYMKLTPSQKQVFKTGILSLLESIARGVPSTVQSGPVVVNMNINMNNVQNENKVEVNIQLKEFLEELEGFLEKLVYPPSYLSKPHPWIQTDAKKLLGKLKKLEEVN